MESFERKNMKKYEKIRKNIRVGPAVGPYASLFGYLSAFSEGSASPADAALKGPAKCLGAALRCYCTSFITAT